MDLVQNIFRARLTPGSTQECMQICFRFPLPGVCVFNCNQSRRKYELYYAGQSMETKTWEMNSFTICCPFGFSPQKFSRDFKEKLINKHGAFQGFSSCNVCGNLFRLSFRLGRVRQRCKVEYIRQQLRNTSKTTVDVDQRRVNRYTRKFISRPATNDCVY